MAGDVNKVQPQNQVRFGASAGLEALGRAPSDGPAERADSPAVPAESFQRAEPQPQVRPIDFDVEHDAGHRQPGSGLSPILQTGGPRIATGGGEVAVLGGPWEFTGQHLDGVRRQ